MEASTEFVNFRLSDDNFKPRLLAPLILLQSGYHIKIRQAHGTHIHLITNLRLIV